MGKILVIYAYYKNINFVLTKCTQNKLNKRFVVVVYFGKYGKGLYSVFYKVRWMLIQYSLSNYKQFSVGKYYFVRVLSAFYLYSEWTARFSKSSMMYGWGVCYGHTHTDTCMKERDRERSNVAAICSLCTSIYGYILGRSDFQKRALCFKYISMNNIVWIFFLKICKYLHSTVFQRKIAAKNCLNWKICKKKLDPKMGKLVFVFDLTKRKHKKLWVSLNF